MSPSSPTCRAREQAGAERSRPLVVVFFYVHMGKPTPTGLLIDLLYALNRPLLCIGYVCAIALLLLKQRVGRLLKVLAAPGRMPLTNYLMQSVIATTISTATGSPSSARWPAPRIAGLRADLRGPDPLQPMVARPLPVRPARVAVAHGRLWKGPAAARTLGCWRGVSVANSDRER